MNLGDLKNNGRTYCFFDLEMFFLVAGFCDAGRLLSLDFEAGNNKNFTECDYGE